jgi:hypothetical protein
MEKSSYVSSDQDQKGLICCPYLSLAINKEKASSRKFSSWQLRSESYFKWLAYQPLSIDFKLSLSNKLCQQKTQALRPP